MCKGGRKQLLSEEEKDKVVELRERGMVMRMIAREMEISTGLVHKVLKEKGYTW